MNCGVRIYRIRQDKLFFFSAGEADAGNAPPQDATIASWGPRVETGPRRNNRLRLILTDEDREQAQGLFPVSVDSIGRRDRLCLTKLMQFDAAKPPPYSFFRLQLPTNSAEEPAIPLQEKASRILAKLLIADPRNSTVRQFLVQSDFWIGYYLARKGATAQALAPLAAVLHSYQALVAADPRDALARQYLAQSHREIAEIFLRQGNSAGAMKHAREAVAADQALVASESAPDEMKLSKLAQSEVTLGNAWASAAAQNKNAARQADADWQGAQVSFEAALRTMGKMKRPDSAKRGEIGRELAVPGPHRPPRFSRATGWPFHWHGAIPDRLARTTPI